MEFEKIDIQELLPQRPPFVMVDRLLFCDRQTTRTALTVREDNIFFDRGVLAEWASPGEVPDDGALSEAGLLENIAQTCAARMGFINKYVCNDTVKIGFIGAIRQGRIARLPRAGETLVTQIDTIEEVFQMTLVDAKVCVGSEVIASCEMKISITDIDGK